MLSDRTATEQCDHSQCDDGRDDGEIDECMRERVRSPRQVLRSRLDLPLPRVLGQEHVFPLQDLDVANPTDRLLDGLDPALRCGLSPTTPGAQARPDHPLHKTRDLPQERS